jgi:hypothetical protein
VDGSFKFLLWSRWSFFGAMIRFLLHRFLRGGLGSGERFL